METESEITKMLGEIRDLMVVQKEQYDEHNNRYKEYLEESSEMYEKFRQRSPLDRVAQGGMLFAVIYLAVLLAIQHAS